MGLTWLLIVGLAVIIGALLFGLDYLAEERHRIIFSAYETSLSLDSVRYEALRIRLDQLQDTLNAMQVDKLKVYVNERNDKPKLAPAMDFEASQKAVLEEFKEN